MIPKILRSKRGRQESQRRRGDGKTSDQGCGALCQGLSDLWKLARTRKGILLYNLQKDHSPANPCRLLSSTSVGQCRGLVLDHSTRQVLSGNKNLIQGGHMSLSRQSGCNVCDSWVEKAKTKEEEQFGNCVVKGKGKVWERDLGS